MYETYKNPDEVLKVKNENELIRIDGVCVDCISTTVLGRTFLYNVKYTVSFYFKDGKYKMDIVTVEYDQGSPSGSVFSLKDSSRYYKKMVK